MSEMENRSAPALVGDLVTHVTELFRKEMQLFRAEMNEKANQAMTACGMIVAGLVIALTALNVLAAALVAAIENAGLAAGWAALIVGAVFALIAWMLASRGINNLKASSLAPSRTTSSVQKDAQVARERVT